MRFFFLFSLFVGTVFALDIKIASSTVSNGKTALLEFKKEKNISYEDIALGSKRYKIFKNPLNDEMFYALIPVDYYEKPSDKKVEIYYKQGSEQKSKSLFFRVESADYEKETLSVDGSKVVLSKKDQQRASKEYVEAMEVYKKTTMQSYISSEFIIPLDSKITSDFGKARVYNGSLKSYHGGTDFRAGEGEPLIACNNGKVVLSKDRFYSGGTVVIDHGHGIYSCYFHMSKLDVKEGVMVKKGETIGLSGSSGRVTGPHLHFGIRVAAQQVDPLQFIELMNENILKGIK
ncbi:M23 family metallopeptidase [Sulfurimonas sp.]|uniref:M23 family metallopeptidase n=1 Tax=Sulfurimonas sp. TaxID=2022749 RepID=UPI0019EE3EE5|nr:M23 family metallopeptidase [Sulfurimonas sp.]MBE0515502.1 M23 family metallopeptidase [Sulfurimonas sp.]